MANESLSKRTGGRAGQSAASLRVDQQQLVSAFSMLETQVDRLGLRQGVSLFQRYSEDGISERLFSLCLDASGIPTDRYLVHTEIEKPHPDPMVLTKRHYINHAIRFDLAQQLAGAPVMYSGELDIEEEQGEEGEIQPRWSNEILSADYWVGIESCDEGVVQDYPCYYTNEYAPLYKKDTRPETVHSLALFMESFQPLDIVDFTLLPYLAFPDNVE